MSSIHQIQSADKQHPYGEIEYKSSTDINLSDLLKSCFAILSNIDHLLKADK